MLLKFDYFICFRASRCQQTEKVLDPLIRGTHSGFMMGCYIGNNIRFVLDLLDYIDQVNDDSIVAFLFFLLTFKYQPNILIRCISDIVLDLFKTQFSVTVT